MNIIIADTYAFYIHNSKSVKFPKEFSNHKIIWDMRQALLELWTGKIKEVAIPKLGTPGYDFEDFINKMKEIGQISEPPKIKWYELTVDDKKST